MDNNSEGIPEISVIIPTYNLAGYIEECVQSVIAQTIQPVEILIVDNNSTDGTLEIVLKLADRYRELIRVLKEPRQGAPLARNLGLKEAKGEWIQFLDGDDLLMPDKLRYQISFAQPCTGFIVGPVVRRDIQGHDHPMPFTPSWEGLFIGGGAMGLTSSNLWNTQAVRSVNGWDTGLSSTQEYDLMFRLLQAGYLFAAAPDVATICRRRISGQISSAPYSERLPPILSLHTRLLKYLLEHHEVDTPTIHRYLTIYFQKYTHLRDRDANAAAIFRKEMMDQLLTPDIVRKYPRIRSYRLKSQLLTLYRGLKRTFRR